MGAPGTWPRRVSADRWLCSTCLRTHAAMPRCSMRTAAQRREDKSRRRRYACPLPRPASPAAPPLRKPVDCRGPGLSTRGSGGRTRGRTRTAASPRGGGSRLATVDIKRVAWGTLPALALRTSPRSDAEGVSHLDARWGAGWGRRARGQEGKMARGKRRKRASWDRARRAPCVTGEVGRSGGVHGRAGQGVTAKSRRIEDASR